LPQQEFIMRDQPKTMGSLLIAAAAAFAPAVPLVSISAIPATAQVTSVAVEFHAALDPYGTWRSHRRWGEVWIPPRVARDWEPYTVGHWVYSQDYGWYWASDDEEADWGLVTYHYGRWVFDDEFGWMWVPGTEWGPGWVQWRYGPQYAGWAPLPPEEAIVEYGEQPQFWIFVRERDLVAPRIVEVILAPRDREVVFRETVIVNRTVVLADRRFAVNPGIPPAYIAAAYGRPIPSYAVKPRVFAGTANLPGAVVVRAEDFRSRERAREISRESAFVRQTTNTITPARDLLPLAPLGANERGRLGPLPPRAAQPGTATTGQNRPEGAPATQGAAPPASQLPNRPAQPRQGAAPGQPLQEREGRPGAQGAGPGAAQGQLRGNEGQRDQRSLREGRHPAPNVPGTVPNTSGAAPGEQRNEGPADVRGNQPARDQRNLREGRPVTPSPNAPSTSGEAPRVPQATAPGARGSRNEPPGFDQRSGPEGRGLGEREGPAGRPGNFPGREPGPSTSGTAPSGRERGGERELGNRPPQTAPLQEPRGRERPGIEGPRSQSFGGERGEPQRTAPAMPRAPEGPRPQSPTTGAAPGGIHPLPPGGPGRRDER
jgi:hypothetical protein